MQNLSPREVKVNRIKLLILWLIPLGLMGIAALCYYLVQSGKMSIGSTNHGEFMSPPLNIVELTEQATSAATPFATNNKWSMVVRAEEDCDERCREALYLSRQIHIRLDKSANRVQRVLLVDSLPLSAETTDHIEQEHQLLKMVEVPLSSLEQIDGATQSAKGELPVFTLVDPDGWIMMAYYAEHEGNGMLKDIKHLLKITKER